MQPTEGTYERWEMRQVRQGLWVKLSLDWIRDERGHQRRDYPGLIGLGDRFDRQRTHARDPTSQPRDDLLSRLARPAPQITGRPGGTREQKLSCRLRDGRVG